MVEISTRAADVFRAASARLEASDIDGYLGYLADDVRFEFPFASPPVPRIIDGKPAVQAHLRRRGGLLAAPRITAMEVYSTDHPGTVIAETTLRDRSGKTRTAISVTTISDELIISYRDYFNPLEAGPGAGDSGA